jgi:hypothetical protein
MEVEYDTDNDKQGRPRAVNVRVVRDEQPYVQRPGERRQCQTRVMHAERSVELEPAALTRDRARHRDFRARRDRGAAIVSVNDQVALTGTTYAATNQWWGGSAILVCSSRSQAKLATGGSAMAL